MRRTLLLPLGASTLICLLGACGDDRGSIDASVEQDSGPGDAAVMPDAGSSDAGSSDADSPDAAERDAGRGDDGGSDAGDDGGPGACEGGSHLCGETCASDTSIDTCGDRCAACPEPDGSAASCDGAACGFVCEAGRIECDGACVPVSLGCGITLPDDTCSDDTVCGAAGECVDTRCVCEAGYRSCGEGCCPVSLSESTRAATAGDSVQLEFGPDGTAYVMVQTEVTSGEHELRLYSRAPGSRSIVLATETVPVSYDDQTYDFAVRSDGVLFVAAAPSTGEGTNVDLYSWQPGVTAPSMERLGAGFGFNIGVGLGIDSEDTVWVSWSRARSGGLSAASVSATGTRTFNLSSSGTIAQTDIEIDPISGDVFSFWGHRYTGTFRSGVAQLEGTSTLSGVCPADDAEFDSAGRMWSVFNSYSTIDTHVCRAGTETASRDFIVRGDIPRAFAPRLALDRSDVAFAVYYERADYTAHWLTTVDGVRFARGELPVSYVNPSGTTLAGRAFVDVARRPDGGVSMVVVPQDASMGPMTLVDF